MTHDEVTAAMKAEDVPAGLVEKAARAMDATRGWKGHTRVSARSEFEARHALSAVLPEIQAQALKELDVLIEEDYDARTREMSSRHEAYAEGFLDGHEAVQNLVQQHAARLTTTTEEPTT